MTRRASVLVLPAYLALTLALTWPLIRDLDRRLPADAQPIDALMQAFVLEWDWKALARDPLRVYDVPRFHPLRGTLAYMDPLLGEAVLGAPIYAATRSVPAAYGALVIFSFVATAWAVYRLGRLVGGSRPGAFLAGFFAAFSHYRLGNLASLNQLHTEWVPLGLFFALRFLLRGRMRDLVLAASALVVQSTFGWYYTIHLATALALMLGWAAWKRALPAASARRILPAAIAACALVAVVAIPHERVRRSDPSFRRTLGQAALYSARLEDYVRAGPGSRTGGVAAPDPGHAYAVGLATLVLAMIARPWRRRTRTPRSETIPALRTLDGLALERFLLILGAAGFVLSLGPVLQAAGHRFPIPLPYAVLHFVIPGFSSMRAPGRFAELVVLSAAVLAAVGFDRARRRFLGGGRAATALLFGGALGLAVAETFAVPMTLIEYPRRAALPPVYAWLARQPGDVAILELPMPARESEESPRDAIRQIHSLAHGKPRLDGVSGYSPPAHEAFRGLVQDFPSARAARAAYARGARLVIVRFGELDRARAERLRAGLERSPDLEIVARFGSDEVYAWRARGAPESKAPDRR